METYFDFADFGIFNNIKENENYQQNINIIKKANILKSGIIKIYCSIDLKDVLDFEKSLKNSSIYKETSLLYFYKNVDFAKNLYNSKLRVDIGYKGAMFYLSMFTFYSQNGQDVSLIRLDDFYRYMLFKGIGIAEILKLDKTEVIKNKESEVQH